jgi:hypothetical protein
LEKIPSAFDDAAPVDGRGHRTNETLLRLNERDRYLIEAARFYPDMSNRETARQLRIALSTYRAGRWRRDRSEATCPTQHQAKLTATLWAILKTKDALVSDRTIRRALATPTRGPTFEV